jgi:uncharacterized RDD family membrane protein YckC
MPKSPPASPSRPPARPRVPRRPARRTPERRQSSLDFLPPLPQPRKLRTSAEAAIYCDAPVAPRLLRVGASLLDGLVVLAGEAVFLAVLYYKGGGIPWSPPAIGIYGAAFILMFLFYKLLACVLDQEAAGTKWAGLRLLHFDGRPADRQQRLLRLASGCLSVLPACAGLLWALADEERLTWHDHMSKTFLTER